MTDRAISTTVGYVITLGITSLLVSGLLIAGGGFVQDTRQGTVQDELEVIGQQLAADIASADRLAGAGGPNAEVRIERELPDTVTGRTYSVSVTDSTSGPSEVTLTLSTEDPDVSVDVSLYVQRDVATGDLQGGDVVIELNTAVSPPEIEVSGA